MRMCSPGRTFGFLSNVSAVVCACAASEQCCLPFQELEDEKALTPTNFKEYMGQQAKETRLLNEQVQQFKAVLQTRGEL